MRAEASVETMFANVRGAVRTARFVRVLIPIRYSELAMFCDLGCGGNRLDTAEREN